MPECEKYWWGQVHVVDVNCLPHDWKWVNEPGQNWWGTVPTSQWIPMFRVRKVHQFDQLDQLKVTFLIINSQCLRFKQKGYQAH